LFFVVLTELIISDIIKISFYFTFLLFEQFMNTVVMKQKQKKTKLLFFFNYFFEDHSCTKKGNSQIKEAENQTKDVV
jgi:hypothetical protein